MYARTNVLTHRPILNPSARKKPYERSWNNLPSDNRTASSVTIFKNLLKTHLFIQSYYSTKIRVSLSHAVRRPCSDFMDMLRRLINCRIIIIIIIIKILTQYIVIAKSERSHFVEIVVVKSLLYYPKASVIVRRDVVVSVGNRLESRVARVERVWV